MSKQSRDELEADQKRYHWLIESRAFIDFGQYGYVVVLKGIPRWKFKRGTITPMNTANDAVDHAMKESTTK